MINKYFQKFGLIPDPDDPRDVPLGAIEAIGDIVDYPEQYFSVPAVEAVMAKVNNQKTQPTCVGESGDRIKEAQELSETKKFIDFSPRFLYALSKKIDGWSGRGTYLRAAMKVLKKYGIAEEQYHQSDYNLDYDTFKDWRLIPDKAYKQAEQYKIKGYITISKVFLDFCRGIFSTGTIMMGFTGTRAGWRKYPVREPKQGEKIFGHAVVGIGYDKKKKLIYFVNSWGEDWGETIKLKKIKSSEFGEYYIMDKRGSVEIKGIGAAPKSYIQSKWGFNAWAAYDLPNDWRQKTKMFKTLKDANKPDVYLVFEGKKYRFIDEATYRLFAELQMVPLMSDVPEDTLGELKNYKDMGVLPSKAITDLAARLVS